MRARRAGGRKGSRVLLSPTRRLVADARRIALFVRDARRRESGKLDLRSSRTSARPRRAFKWKRKVNAPIKAAVWRSFVSRRGRR